LGPTLRQQLGDVGPQLPGWWESGRLTPAQKKECLRSLVRRVIVSRPIPDTVDRKLVWGSGAYAELTIQQGTQHTADLTVYDRIDARAAPLGVLLGRQTAHEAEVELRLQPALLLRSEHGPACHHTTM